MVWTREETMPRKRQKKDYVDGATCEKTKKMMKAEAEMNGLCLP